MPDSKYAPRRAEPGSRFVFNHAVGGETVAVRLSADDDGIVQPKNALEDEVAGLLSLPIARIAEPKAASAAKEA